MEEKGKLLLCEVVKKWRYSETFVIVIKLDGMVDSYPNHGIMWLALLDSSPEVV